MTSEALKNRKTDENSLIELLSSSSARTLYVFSFSGGTPWISRIWTTARENPHWGSAGVPFMKSTTGLALMADCILERASCEI